VGAVVAGSTGAWVAAGAAVVADPPPGLPPDALGAVAVAVGVGTGVGGRVTPAARVVAGPGTDGAEVAMVPSGVVVAMGAVVGGAAVVGTVAALG
jgi:hypothetical protein